VVNLFGECAQIAFREIEPDLVGGGSEIIVFGITLPVFQAIGRFCRKGRCFILAVEMERKIHKIQASTDLAYAQ